MSSIDQTKTTDSGVTVIVPAFNEAAAIASTLRDLQQTLSALGRRHEIIVVDDGSADDTATLAEKTGVQLIRHPANMGYGRAILTGIDRSAFETVAVVDADGSYPIETLPQLLAMYDRGFDMVVGARQGPYYYSSLTKRFLRLLFKFLAEFSTGRSIPDINSGMRVFRKTPVIAFQASISTGFSFTTTVTLLFMLSGLFVGYSPIAYRQRVGVSKVHLTRDSLRSLQIIFGAIARFNPLKLYLLLIIGDVVFTLLFAALGEQTGWHLSSLILFLGGQAICLIIAIAILAASVSRRITAVPTNEM